MEIILTGLFKDQFKKCPLTFQLQFRKVYQQLKVVDWPLEVKGVTSSLNSRTRFKVVIDASRIGMYVKSDKLYISCFLYNQFF